MDNFLSKQNKGLIWDILDENLTIDINYKPEVFNLLESNFVPFYEKEKHNSGSLIDLNKKYIMLIKNYVNKNFNNKPDYKKEKQELITSQDINKNNQKQFDAKFNYHKTDFDNMINLKKPEVPEFAINNSDVPLKETDKLIEEIIKNRNYDISIIHKNNDKNNDNNKIDNSINQKELNKNSTFRNININEEIDSSEFQKEIIHLDKKEKHISWADKSLDTNNIFTKLKKISNINDLQTNDITNLNNKLDKISEKLDVLLRKLN
jgi:hypothetical protein